MKKVVSLLLVMFTISCVAQPLGCDTQAIRNALTGAGYYELTVPSQPCSMYFVNPTLQTPIAAQQAAQQFGAHLVSFQNAQENQDVLNAMYNSPYSPANYLVWIGLGDAVQEGSFQWYDGTAFTYTNWSPNEPNNQVPSCCGIPVIGCVPPDIRCQQGEDCVLMYGNGTWNDFGCDVNHISVIEINLCMQATATTDSAIVCVGNTATLSVSAKFGSTPFTYNWNQGSGSGSTYTVSPTSTTSYTVRVTDRWGCYADDTVIVATQTCSAPQPGCDVNAIRAAFTAAGYNELLGVQGQPCSMYFINPVSQNANLAEQAAQQLGAHLVVFNDAAENQAVVDALNASGIIASVGAVWIGYSDEITEGNWITLDGTPMTYTNWATNEPNNLGQGATCCSFPDFLGGCQTSEAWRCQYGEDCAQIYASGQWNDLPCDRNSVSVIEVNLCPVITVSNDTAICAGNSVVLTASTLLGSTPYTYSWSPGSGTSSTYTVNPANTTSYIVSVTDRWGCFAKDTVTVTVQGGSAQSFTVNPNPVCENFPVTVSYTGNTSSAATYNWNFDGGNIVSGSGQGPYQIIWQGSGVKNITLNVSDNGCASPQVTQQVTVNTNPVADAGADATVCSGNQVQLGTAPVAGYTYQWFPATNLSSASIANPVYNATNSSTSPIVVQYVLGVMQNGCLDSDTVQITVNPSGATTISASGVTDFCNGGNVSLTADSVFSNYVWSNNATTNNITVTQSGNYTLTGTDASGCQFISNTITVTVYPNPLITLVNSADESCFGLGDGSITVSASNGTSPYSYLWNTNPSQSNATAALLSQGSYTVTVTDANTCTASATFTIGSPTPLQVSVSNIADVSCYGFTDGSALLSVSGGNPSYSYTWSNGATGNPLNNVGAGTYTVTVADANNCTANATAIINEPPLITFTMTGVDSVRFGEEIPLLTNVQPSTGNYTYEWNPATYLSCSNCPSPYFSAIRTTEYEVTVTDNFGCSVTATVTIHVLPDKPVFIPNVFTPNNDSQNDYFNIFANGVNYYSLKVFNRWGEKVFESYNATVGWDGTYLGKEAAPGVYTYTAIITFLDGENRQYKGTVTLLR